MRELKQMEFGGNKAAKAFYEKNGMLTTGQPPDHKNPALTRYKNELKMKAEAACKELGIAVGGAATTASSQPEAKSTIIITKKDGPPAVPEKKETAAEVKAPVEQPAKKKRTFVEESDVFDFSGLQKVASNVTEESKKSDTVAPLSKQSSAAKKSTGFDDDDFAMGGLFQGKSVQLGGGANKNLNAKKLDIDFGDGDDFFN